jgi:hypothetical protein
MFGPALPDPKKQEDANGEDADYYFRYDAARW